MISYVGMHGVGNMHPTLFVLPYDMFDVAHMSIVCLWNCQSLAVVTILRGLDAQSHEHETGCFLFFLSLTYSCVFSHLFIFLSTYKSPMYLEIITFYMFSLNPYFVESELVQLHINILSSLIAHKKKNSHCLIQFFIRIFLVYLIENTYMVTIGFGCWENRIAGTALK